MRRAASDSFIGSDKPLPRFMSPTRTSAIRGIITQTSLSDRSRAPYSAAPVPSTTSDIPKDTFADVLNTSNATPGPGSYLPQDFNSSFRIRPSSAPRGRPTTPTRSHSSSSLQDSPGPGHYNLLTPTKQRYTGPPVWMGSAPRFGSAPLNPHDVLRSRRYAPGPAIRADHSSPLKATQPLPWTSSFADRTHQ